MWALPKEISLFFSSSPKRQDKLIEVIKSHESNEVKVKKLLDLCRTRWVARHTALVTFQALYSAVVDTRGQISQVPRSQWNADTASKTSSLLKSAVDFGFITTFMIVSEVMSYVHSLTIALQ